MRIGLKTAIALSVLIVALQIFFLFVFGQPPICECGYVKFWEGAVLSAGNSQHLADWYTFSHVVHGVVFYAVLAWLLPGLPLRVRILFAFGIESAWEIAENTPIVIEHYRQQALAAGYIGDSILNSAMDTLFMAFGFLLTWKMPWWVSLALVLGMELFVLYMIRDNLTLNVVNLLYPIPSLSEWQLQGGIK